MEDRRQFGEPLERARGLARLVGDAVLRLRDRLRLALPSENRFLGDLGGRFGTIEEALAAFRRDRRLLLADPPGPEATDILAERRPGRPARPVASRHSSYEGFRDRVEGFAGTCPPGSEEGWSPLGAVATRAVDWTWAYDDFRPEILDDRRLASLLLRSLFAHGRFLAQPPADPIAEGGVASCAALVARLVLGVLFRGAPEADAWKGVALSRIVPEVDRLVGADGVLREGSIGRHAALLEMTLLALLVAERSGFRLPELRSRVRGMADFLACSMKPDGLWPQVGETAAVRLTLPGGGGADERDHRHLLAVAGCAFDDDDLFALAGDRWEEAFWIFGESCAARLRRRGERRRPGTGGRVFEAGGFAILRHDDLYALVRTGGAPAETAHHDLLSLEMQAGGLDLLLDPGAAPEADPPVRARLRSTSGHSTVRVDGQEIHPPRALADPGAPAAAEPPSMRFVSQAGFDLVEAEHHGYLTLPDPVRHRRIIVLGKRRRSFVIEDRLEGSGRHRLEWFFHLAPDWEAALDQGTTLVGRRGGAGLILRATLLPPGARAWLANDLVTDARGNARPAQTLIFDWTGPLPIVARFTLEAPRAGGESAAS